MNPNNEPNKTLIYVVTEKDSGGRLDIFLAARTTFSRSQIKQLIQNNRVIVNGNLVKAGYTLKKADEIVVEIVKPKELQLEPENIPLEIVYQDLDLALINKQANLVVHPGAGNLDGTLVNALLYHGLELSDLGDQFRPGIVHRLDKDTTGLMLIAKNNLAHRFLTEQIKEYKIKRRYLALVHGLIKKERGTIEKAIGRHPRERRKMTVKEDGRYAVTHYRVKEQINNRYTLVECQLETGRTHQIRVHFAALNHPIVGDQIYGTKKFNLGSTRQMLHAFYLGFTHPRGKWMDFTIDLPKDFSEILAKARKIS